MKSQSLSALTIKNPSQRMADAISFLERAKEEITRGRATGDKLMVREGAEKLFHALNEGCAARIQKYGLGVPQSHDEVLRGLEAAREDGLKADYESAFSELHVKAYYRGWIDPTSLGEQIKRVEAALAYIKKKIKR